MSEVAALTNTSREHLLPLHLLGANHRVVVRVAQVAETLLLVARVGHQGGPHPVKVSK